VSSVSRQRRGFTSLIRNFDSRDCYNSSRGATLSCPSPPPPCRRCAPPIRCATSSAAFAPLTATTSMADVAASTADGCRSSAPKKKHSAGVSPVSDTSEGCRGRASRPRSRAARRCRAHSAGVGSPMTESGEPVDWPARGEGSDQLGAADRLAHSRIDEFTDE